MSGQLANRRIALAECRECDDLILYTGEGVRRLVGFAERAGLRDDFVAALGRVKKITRGPKPVRALREIGAVLRFCRQGSDYGRDHCCA
jgi:hypothetical protein